MSAEFAGGRVSRRLVPCDKGFEARDASWEMRALLSQTRFRFPLLCLLLFFNSFVNSLKAQWKGKKHMDRWNLGLKMDLNTGQPK